MQAMNRKVPGHGASADGIIARFHRFVRRGALSSLVFATVWSVPTVTVAAYSEFFNGPSVPTNWFAQNGTAGLATLAITDDTGGINSGNALMMTSATRQGVIGSFPEVMFANVGDSIELRFDARLTSFPNNAGGFRFGLYHDNGGSPALSSGYRALLGTGTSYLSTDVQADGGDPDIAFGTNRENPIGFASDEPGINDNNPHSFAFILTRTTAGVSMNVFQDGNPNFPAPVEHITGQGAGVPTPIQTKFNQIAFTTNGGYVALVDNVRVNYFVPGDVTGDGLVNNDDFNVILAAMFTSVTSRMEGDLTGDGFVDFADYRQWKDTPKSGTGAGSSVVPEPSTLASIITMAIGIVTVVANRRRARSSG
jgi:hypothetical protein